MYMIAKDPKHDRVPVKRGIHTIVIISISLVIPGICFILLLLFNCAGESFKFVYQNVSRGSRLEMTEDDARSVRA